METKKTSKRSVKTSEISVAAVKAAEPSPVDSKPVERTAAAKSAAAVITTTAKASTPKNSSHRHSKLSLPVTPAVDHNEIAKLAYKYWEERHYADGFADEDWHRAEKTLSARA